MIAGEPSVLGHIWHIFPSYLLRYTLLPKIDSYVSMRNSKSHIFFIYFLGLYNSSFHNLVIQYTNLYSYHTTKVISSDKLSCPFFSIIVSPFYFDVHHVLFRLANIDTIFLWYTVRHIVTPFAPNDRLWFHFGMVDKQITNLTVNYDTDFHVSQTDIIFHPIFER